MEFRNHTPFPALAFEGVDPLEQAFHVIVLRQTLTWGADGKLVYADAQAPLCEEDSPFETPAPAAHAHGGHVRAVRQESDLCHYKPRCDVIVNATAYPPRAGLGILAPRRFAVRLSLWRPNRPRAIHLPPAPEGLNPFMAPSPEAVKAWQRAVAKAQREAVEPGACLIDKALIVTGARHYVRRAWPLRLLGSALALGSLGLWCPAHWRLTRPQRARPLPLTAAHAFGGHWHVHAGSRTARKLPKKLRLSPAQTAAHQPADADTPPPAALDALAANPAGIGYARNAYLKASGTKRLPAPQIEHAHRSLTAGVFRRVRAGRLQDAEPLVAGLGVRPKSHPERARLVGTVDDAFIQGDAWLPADFDFAVWNAAWPDQQVEHLQGDEILELTNLCAPEAAGAEHEATGNTVLRLALPGHLPFVLVRYESGAIGELAAQLDTLMIEPERQQLTCVWRATVGKHPAIRVLEARMLLREQVQAHRQAQVESEGALAAETMA